MAVVLAVIMAMALAGCGGGSGGPAARGSAAQLSGGTPAEMKLERADLAIVGNGLLRAEPSIQGELSASRAAWPSVVRGLPPRVSAAKRLLISAAVARAGQIATPRFISYAGELTGSAAAIAGLLLSFEELSHKGWVLTQSATDHLMGEGPAGSSTGGASPTAVSFLRVNASLYIGCVYDAHYNLSVIGEDLRRAYLRLGGGAAFGAALRQEEIERIVRFYSPSTARLTPRPPPSPAGS